MALNIELSVDGVVIPQVGGVYTLDSIDIFDFGKVIQVKITNKDVIPLKDHYVLICGDSTDKLYGERYVSISNYDGTNQTISEKLYLKNNNILTDQSEIFQIHISPKYGVTNATGLKIQLAITNHVVNMPMYSII